MQSISVNTGSLRNTASLMSVQIDELDNMLSKIDSMIGDTKEYFDTPASEYFREISISYVAEERKYLSDVLLPLVNSLNTVADEYDRSIAEDQKQVEAINI